MQSGGRLSVELEWQALTAIDEDYTVFVQILNDQDQIVGQVDSWPLQGTYPTSQWSPGEIINDPIIVQLDSELISGPYKLYIGLYLLETLRRLPLVDDDGNAMDDKVIVPGLVVTTE